MTTFKPLCYSDRVSPPDKQSPLRTWLETQLHTSSSLFWNELVSAEYTAGRNLCEKTEICQMRGLLHYGAIFCSKCWMIMYVGWRNITEPAVIRYYTKVISASFRWLKTHFSSLFFSPTVKLWAGFTFYFVRSNIPVTCCSTQEQSVPEMRLSWHQSTLFRKDKYDLYSCPARIFFCTFFVAV